MGIVSIFLSILIVPAIVGVILGIVGVKKAGRTSPPIGKGKAITGIVLSVIALVLGIGIVSTMVGAFQSSGDGPAVVQENAEGDAAEGGGAVDEGGDGGAVDEEAAEQEVAGIGDPVRDGKFEFTVTEVETGVAELGDEFLGETAQGQFVLVHVTVENIGDESQYFDGDNVTAYDADGREFSADTSAAIYLDESNSFLNEINPGNKVEGIVVFDVPEGVTLTRLTLHDSLFSGGVDVSLT